jgi:GntR family transcriptional regulator, transcriptional repressor for pyruvate dehydrogenase complex
MTEHAIAGLQAEFARAACFQRSENDLRVLRESIDQASRLDGGWEGRAGAHAQFHCLLADASGGGAYAMLARLISDSVRDLMRAAGPDAEDVIVAAHRRLVACVEERDADGATWEMERFLAMLGQGDLAAVNR